MSTGTRHGTWWNRFSDSGIPLSEAMQGRFTRLFDDALPAKFDDGDLAKLAAAMTADPDIPPTSENEVDAEENPAVTAAYTYLGQFVDHDLTLDPTSHLRQQLSKDQLTALVDFRTPRFDLDSLYGRGPDDQPYLYQPDGIRLQLGAPMSGNPHDPAAVDLPRGPNGRALVGDPRNDENRIVAQLHSAMLRFHNAMADRLPDADFDTVRQQVRWHYQWVLVHDFLPTLINATTIGEVFPHIAKGTSITADPPQFRIPRLRRNGLFGNLQPAGLELMPVEFSVAAYRFGHSMIRPIYRLNESISRRQIFSTATDPAGDLGGMRPIPLDWAIDWQFFIDLDHGNTPAQNDANDPLTRKPQHAYKIDTSLVNPLGMLPALVAVNPSSLTLRNLLRGQTFELPSGQTVAQALGVKVIPDEELVIGKATKDDPKQPLVAISPAFANNAPLWTYVLSEAQVTSWAAQPNNPDKDTIPIRLGPVGGHLVAEVFAALLEGDQTSVLHADNFTPLPELAHQGTFGLAELLNAALRRTP